MGDESFKVTIWRPGELPEVFLDAQLPTINDGILSFYTDCTKKRSIDTTLPFLVEAVCP
jgi:hypothetical protein